MAMEIKRERCDVGGQRSATWTFGAMFSDVLIRVEVRQPPDVTSLVRDSPYIQTFANTVSDTADSPAVTAAIARMLAEAQAQAEEWDKDTDKPWPVKAEEVSE